MRVFGVWHGGASYSFGDVITDMESWASLEAAKASLLDRYAAGHWRRDTGGRVVNFDEDGWAHLGEPDDSLRPCVDESTEILLYPCTQALSGGRGYRVDTEYPYARLFLGPRRGVRVESC